MCECVISRCSGAKAGSSICANPLAARFHTALLWEDTSDRCIFQSILFSGLAWISGFVFSWHPQQYVHYSQLLHLQLLTASTMTTQPNDCNSCFTCSSSNPHNPNPRPKTLDLGCPKAEPQRHSSKDASVRAHAVSLMAAGPTPNLQTSSLLSLQVLDGP